MLQSYRLLPVLLALLTVALGTEEIRAQDAYNAAIQHYQSGQWQSAALAFDQVVLDPQQAKATREQAQLYCGECLTQLGSYAEARQRYESVREHASSTKLQAQSLFRLGEVSWLAGERVEGARLLKSYLTKYPLGNSVSYAKEYLQQIDERKALVANFEILDSAVGLERNGRYDEALGAYAEILQSPAAAADVRAETLRRSALLHERLAQPREAIGLHQQYLAAYPDSKRTAEVMLSIAWNHVRLDQTAQAEDQFQAVLAKFPQSAQAAVAGYWLAQKRAEENSTEQSLALVEQVLRQEQLPERQPQVLAKALCLNCQLLSLQAEWKGIESLVEGKKELVAEGPLRTRLEFWSAEAAFRLRDYKIARQRFAALQPQTIGIAEAWTAMVPLRRAQLAARRQQWREVLSIVERTEREFPDFELQYELDYLRGRALAGLGNMTAARKFYRRVVNSKEGKDTEAATMASWMIGETFFHQHDYPRAREAYQLVMERKSFPEWQSRAALQAGKCWELEKRWDEAADLYAKALQRWPRSFSEQQLESRLRWAQNQSTTEKTTQQR